VNVITRPGKNITTSLLERNPATISLVFLSQQDPQKYEANHMVSVWDLPVQSLGFISPFHGHQRAINHDKAG